jgi:capsular exopolysaccharide synthesis family protein
MSRFAETIRSIKVTADFGDAHRKDRVLGIVSSVKGEGKSTVCLNLAMVIASAGKSVLLVDCDLRNPTLSRGLRVSHSHTLVGMLRAPNSISALGHSDPRKTLHFLPAGAELLSKRQDSFELLGSPEMAKLIQHAKELYDYVILDFPPLIPLVDVRAAALVVDGLVLVVKWAATPEGTVREALSLSTTVSEKLIGAVLNWVDLKGMATYQDYGDTVYPDTAYTDYAEAPAPAPQRSRGAR